MMKKQKHNTAKSFYCSIAIVLAIVLIGTVMSLQVFALNETKTETEESKTGTKEETTSAKAATCTYDEALKHYNVVQSVYETNDDGTSTVTITAEAGELYVIGVEEGSYNSAFWEPKPDPNKKGKYILGPDPKDVIVAPNFVDPAFEGNGSTSHVLNLSEVKGAIITKKHPLKLRLSKDNENYGVVQIKIGIKTGDSKCDSYEEFQSAKENNEKRTTAVIYQVVDLPQDGLVGDIENDHYKSEACKFVRGESNNYTALKDDIKNKYKSQYIDDYRELLGYCFSTYVKTNYNDTQLQSLISATLKSVEIKNQLIESASSSKYGNVNFDTWKENAIAENHVFATKMNEDKAELVTQPGALYCEYDSLQDSRITKTDGTTMYNYANNHYYYASSETVKTADYIYRYDGTDKGRVKVETKPICKTTCEEVVEVSYGPPQAVIAGFCFEYQVKVTSKTQCKALIQSEPPVEQGFCTPTPRCDHSNGYVSTQGGPNEDYDMCIQKCDGGKYTQKCSKSCYNKVYGKTTKVKGTALTDDMYATVDQVINNVPSSGKYVRGSDGKIHWKGDGFARWYVYVDPKRWGADYIKPGAGGFKKQYVGTKKECTGVCYNTGCEGDVYLNPEDAAADYQYNLEEYLTKLAECQAGATCTEHTSTYNIKIDYDTEVASDSKTFNGQLTSPSENPNAVTENSMLMDKDGCYAKTAQDYYRSEWSFPGTWVNNKTGEISYTEKNSGWHQQKDKVCLPLNAKEVNKSWWNWYMLQKYNVTSNSTSGSITNSSSCTIGHGNVPNTGDIKWNIKANATKFGYYGWNFNMNCFYAVGSELKKEETSDNKDCIVAASNYETRTVTNSDLFPSDKTTGSIKTEVNGLTTGRTPGFNWTDSASIPEKKNDKYAVTPSVLIEKIQKLGNKVYEENGGTEDYLDYEFDLTPQDLNNIKKFNGKYSDGAKNGYNNYGNSFEYDKESKLYIYKSNLFRTSEKVISAKRVGLLGCNNQTSPTSCGTNTKK